MSKQGSPQRKASISFSDSRQEQEPQESQSGGAFIDLEQPENKSPTRRSPTGSVASPEKTAASPKSGSPKGSPERKSPKEQGSPKSPQSPKEPKEKHSVTDTIQIQEDKYIPSPYTFRAPPRAKHFTRISAKCPPFYLQLDHTLAVIWTLFSDNPPISLGIAQLQWALNFLQGIYTRKGEHPKDVALCIQAIEDLLLAKYADMAQEVTIIEEGERRKRMKKMLYVPSEGSVRNASKGTICESETCLARMCLDVDRVISHDADITMSPMPFSVNYFDMSEKIQEYDPYSKQSRASTTVSGVELPQENTMEFLEKWRADQIRKIQSELLRLKSIETYIGCAETNIDSIKETLHKEDSLRDRPQKYYY